jgi:fucose 4-O-acetylase-like acetyltransferase
MVLLVFVHGYNLQNSYLQPFTIVDEKMTFTTFTEYLLSNGLFRFRIPMLFVISGYLFALHDNQSYGKRMGKRLRTLLLPYLLWSAIGLAITFLFQRFSFTAELVSAAGIDQMGDNRPYEQIGWGGMMERWIFGPVSFQLWFIRVLLVYNALYPALRWLVSKIAPVWFSIATLFWLATIGLFFIEGEGLLFFTLGIWLCKKGKDIEQLPRWMNLKLLWVLFIALSLIKTFLAFRFDYRMTHALTLMLLHKLVIATGLLSVWFGGNALVRWWMEKPALRRLTGFSFIIYALHVPLVNYAMQIPFIYGKDIPNYRFLSYIIIPTLIIVLCIGIGYLLRKLAPPVYYVLTGGRGKGEVREVEK